MPGFAHLRRTRDQILASGAEGTADCTELSMGMTHDMAYAIEEGSTIVRVGHRHLRRARLHLIGAIRKKTPLDQ